MRCLCDDWVRNPFCSGDSRRVYKIIRHYEEIYFKELINQYFGAQQEILKVKLPRSPSTPSLTRTWNCQTCSSVNRNSVTWHCLNCETVSYLAPIYTETLKRNLGRDATKAATSGDTTTRVFHCFRTRGLSMDSGDYHIRRCASCLLNASSFLLEKKYHLCSHQKQEHNLAVPPNRINRSTCAALVGKQQRSLDESGRETPYYSNQKINKSLSNISDPLFDSHCGRSNVSDASASGIEKWLSDYLFFFSTLLSLLPIFTVSLNFCWFPPLFPPQSSVILSSYSLPVSFSFKEEEKKSTHHWSF